jgi:hypothetical protein
MLTVNSSRRNRRNARRASDRERQILSNQEWQSLPLRSVSGDATQEVGPHSLTQTITNSASGKLNPRNLRSYAQSLTILVPRIRPLPLHAIGANRDPWAGLSLPEGPLTFT